MTGDSRNLVAPVSHLPKIPTELFDVILNLVRDDPGTLKACALVSHQSLQTAQSHLFSAIQLDPPDLFHLQPNACERFHSLICESPHLATYVRRLSIIDGYHEIDVEKMGDQTYASWNARLLRSTCRCTWVTGNETFHKVLAQLINIEWLTIQGSDSSLEWENLSTELRAALHAIIEQPQLSRIELFGTFGFLPLLRGAAGLNSLSLFDNSMFRRKQFIIHETPGTQNMTRVDSLDIVVGLDLQWIMVRETGSWLDLSGLRSLILRSHGRFGEKNSAFLERVFMSSATLEHLHLQLQSPASFKFLTDLTPFLRLRSFYVELPQNERTCYEEYPTWLIQLLLTIPDSNRIETIAFQLNDSSLDDLFSPDEYANLDLALTRPSLDSLRTVRAKVVLADLKEASMYRDRFPLIETRRILSIEPDAKWVVERDLGCYSGCGWPA